MTQLIQFLVNVEGIDGSGVTSTMKDVTEIVCGGAEVLKIIKFVFELLHILCIVVPIILLIVVGIDFSKNVIAKNESDMDKNVKIATRRIILCVVFFLVPTIIEASINILGDLGVNYMECVDIAKNTTDFSQYKIDYDKIKNKGTLKLQDQETRTITGTEDKNNSSNTDTDTNTSTSTTDSNTNTSGTTSNETTDENSDNTSGTTNTTTSNELKDKSIIYFGDNIVAGFQTTYGKRDAETGWYSKASGNYNWLTTDANNELNKLDDNKKYTIYINMGINDLEHGRWYAKWINGRAKQKKNWKFIVVSVNPVDESKKQVTTTNEKIESFNEKIKGQATNYKYCDTYTTMKAKCIKSAKKASDCFTTNESGKQYTIDNIRQIYELTKKCK